MTSSFRAALLPVSLFTLLGTSSLIASGPAPNERQARFEIRFLQSMMDHHLGGVEMSQMCVQKAVHSELRQACQNIIAAQTSEIQQMQSWLLAWYGINYTPKLPNRGMSRLERLSGADFEIAYMEMISEHHAEALRDSTECLLSAYHREMRDLCERMITAQAREINLFRTWLCQWYSHCEPV